MSFVYLKKLEISGFKSFANKTTLTFLPGELAPGTALGITAIVGPNGSGKSNVADAIRFAIGEQSSKNLRGKKNEDVIFSGTDTKARMGAASVTLYFDNSDKRLPVDYEEVAITRKVFRSGETEYLINGSRVRLMDIADLLAQAGIGKGGYTVINQGMSDALLQATPAERRSMIEDAAGVKQYQIEKTRSKRRLESAEENLNRVKALLIEIEPHLKNLRRQAEKAGKREETEKTLRSKQELLYGYLWDAFQAERGALVREKEVIDKDVFELEVNTKNREHAVRVLGEEMRKGSQDEELQTRVDILRREKFEREKEKTLIEGKVALERERQKTQARSQVLPLDLGHVRSALAQIRSEYAALAEALDAAKDLRDLAGIQQRASALRDKIEALAEETISGEQETTPDPALEPLEKSPAQSEYEYTLAKLSEEIQVSEETLKKHEAEIGFIREKTKQAREDYFEQEIEWRGLEQELVKKKEIQSDLKVRLAKVEVREEDLTTLVSEELHEKVENLSYDGTPVEKEVLEREIAKLKVETEHIGTIDPLVVDEYKETQERYSFLEHEHTDLTQAIASLETVIEEMDGKIEQAFRETFKEVRKKFAHYFSLIFGGGKADLSLEELPQRRTRGDELEEEEEMSGKIEYGIEVTACPPGKKITNLSMLSGGERSLSSLAFLFAIIAHNPPPFAVLDEVEAALDEANSRRFGRMLRELSEHTQFVAITHNRETMSQASLLYGVTMGGDGVSQLLSIQLEEAKAAAK